MDKRKRNLITVGALTLVATAMFFWGLYWLLGNPVLKGGTDVVIALKHGGGLKRSDRVQLQGVEVGSVRGVRLDERGGVIVDLRLNDKLALPADTRATVRADVFGANTVELVPGDAMLQLEDGDTIFGMATPQLTDMATNLSARVESVLISADSLLSASALRDVHATAAVLPGSALELRAAFVELHAAATALRRTTESIHDAQAGPALANAIKEFEKSAQSLSIAAANIDSSVVTFASVMGKIDRGNGTLGRLVNDSTLYLEMNEALREVRALATDIRTRPKKYIDLKVF